MRPKLLFYAIWATTRRYADAGHEVATLGGGALPDKAFERAKRHLAQTVFGVAAGAKG